MDDDDEFGFDNTLEELPANALQELERDALLSTQQPKQNAYSSTIQVDRHGLGRASQQHHVHEDYELIEEEIVDLDALSQDLQHEFGQWNQQPRIVPPSGLAHPGRGELSTNGNGRPSVSIEELQKRLSELENDRADLQRALAEATAVAQVKAGEALVIRQRHEKSTRDYEQKLARMRHLQIEEATKHRADMEALKKEKEKIVTANRFMEHDNVLAAGKSRLATRPAKTGTEERCSPAATPKKNTAFPFGDGFEDVDIVMVSPSKVRDRSRMSTPKGGAKRKRTIHDQSPIPSLPLPLVSPKPAKSSVVNDSLEQANPNNAVLEELAKQTGNLRFLRSVLNHRVGFEPSNDTTLETLSEFALPSKPERKLSNYVYEQLGSINFNLHPHGLAGLFGDIFLQLWADSIRDSYYDPINVLVDILQFILGIGLHSFGQTLIERIVPLAISTCDIVAIPIAQASLKRGSTKAEPSNSQNQGKGPSQTPVIDVFAVLTLLHTVALACYGHEAATTRFWTNMKFDFVLLILMRAQPLPQIELMLKLLRTSPLPTSFGAIIEDAESNQDRQTRREGDTIERLTNLLFDKFKVENLSLNHPTQAKATDTSLDDNGRQQNQERLDLATLNLRLTILSVFHSLMSTSHGSLLLAQHKHVVGRLARFLHLSVASLYSFSPTLHNLHLSSVNTTTRIIYHVITTHKDIVDVREKLRSINGGSHMWLVALTRLAFAETLVTEEGIEEETQDCAHALLDEYLSPMEGEALLQMFSSADSEGQQ